MVTALALRTILAWVSPQSLDRIGWCRVAPAVPAMLYWDLRVS
jgi:hypothetical protein